MQAMQAIVELIQCSIACCSCFFTPQQEPIRILIRSVDKPLLTHSSSSGVSNHI
jgi:hypothetical protein